MPIQCKADIRAVDQEEFHRIDRQVLGVAFGVHNEFGRFLNEPLFQTEIATRCLDMGLATIREMRIRVTHGVFEKEYSVDLIVGDGVVVEIKAVESLNHVHQAQLLNYLFLTGIRFGSLMNLGANRVTRRFVSTSLNPEDRRRIRFVDTGWEPIVPEFETLRERIMALLLDWGAFLDFNLYREAIIHFFGGADQVIKSIPVYSGTCVIGRQKVSLLNDDFVFLISALRSGQEALREHQLRFLKHTRLRGIAWINLNGHNVEFRTLTK